MPRNPDFQYQGRDYLNQIDYAAGTVRCGGKVYPLLGPGVPHCGPGPPRPPERVGAARAGRLVRAFTESERLQRHVQFLYAKGAVYKVCNGNLLYHGAVPMTEDGSFAAETFEGKSYAGKALFDYCDRRARAGYFAAPGSLQRQAGQDFLWYLWCGRLFAHLRPQRHDHL